MANDGNGTPASQPFSYMKKFFSDYKVMLPKINFMLDFYIIIKITLNTT